MKWSAAPALAPCIVLALLCGSSALAQDREVIRIPLSRNDDVVYAIVSGISLDGRWVDVPAAPGGVQIGSRRFRIAFVSDDGGLVEFEAERGRW